MAVAEAAGAVAMGGARNIRTHITLAMTLVMGIATAGTADLRTGPLLTTREIAAGLGSASHLHPPIGECSAQEPLACSRRKHRPQLPISLFTR